MDVSASQSDCKLREKSNEDCENDDSKDVVNKKVFKKIKTKNNGEKENVLKTIKLKIK